MQRNHCLSGPGTRRLRLPAALLAAVALHRFLLPRLRPGFGVQPAQQRGLVAVRPSRLVIGVGRAVRVRSHVCLHIVLPHLLTEATLDVAACMTNCSCVEAGSLHVLQRRHRRLLRLRRRLRLHPPPPRGHARQLLRPLCQPWVPQGVLHRHPLGRVVMHERDDEVFGLVRERGPPALLLEEPLVGPAREERVVGIVDGGVRAVEERLRGQQVEGAPTQAPCIDLCGKVVLLRIELRWPELLGHEAAERHGHLLAGDRVHGEGHRLARVADADLPLAIFQDVEQHVLDRDVLHGQAPLVQAGQALGGLADQHLRVLLVEAPGPETQGLQQVSAGGELRNNKVVVLVTEMVLQLRHMFEAPHHLHKADFAERRLTELVVLLLHVAEAVHCVAIQDLHREATSRGHAGGFVDIAKDGLLQVALDAVDLAAARDVAADCRQRGPWRVRALGGGAASHHDRGDEAEDHGPGKLHLRREHLPKGRAQGADEGLAQHVVVRLHDADAGVPLAQLREHGHEPVDVMQAGDGRPHRVQNLCEELPEPWRVVDVRLVHAVVHRPIAMPNSDLRRKELHHPRFELEQVPVEELADGLAAQGLDVLPASLHRICHLVRGQGEA
mmetsp:Transcript_45117/g.130557  ORF Transcript_45117/g.130557 Transcript_45117/m.130557 type:complete len:612 (-) Transcript_45117:359-2194(-)